MFHPFNVNTKALGSTGKTRAALCYFCSPRGGGSLNESSVVLKVIKDIFKAGYGKYYFENISQ
jgi:hypothetical protein